MGIRKEVVPTQKDQTRHAGEGDDKGGECEARARSAETTPGFVGAGLLFNGG
jgi:hypothetical protein